MSQFLFFQIRLLLFLILLYLGGISGVCFAQTDTLGLSEITDAMTIGAGSESETSSEKKSAEGEPSFKVLENTPEKTVILLTLDAAAIEKLKESASESEKEESSDLEMIVLPDLENDSMTVETIWTKFLNFCFTVKGYCQKNLWNLAHLAVGILVTWFLVWILHFLLDHFLFGKVIKKTATLTDDFFYRASLPPFLVFFWIFGFFLSALPLLKGTHYPQRLILALIAANAAWLLFRLIGAGDKVICLYFRGKKRVFNKLIFDTIRKTLRIILILFAVCFIGQTILGLNISALLAAAGIFGLAIAFAVKDTIANFLSSFMMLFDNSFQLGDRIRAGNLDGDVEAVDFRSTRIRALNGHLYSVPNAVLGTGIIENISQRPGIRFDFELGLTYDTPPDKLERAVFIVRDLISDPQKFIQSPTRSLVTFGSFGEWSLNIRVMLWFNTQNFVESEQWKHDLNMAILRKFTEEEIEFAFPTQTIFAPGNTESGASSSRI